ncbi:MAG TPA: hypothetical protein ENH82_16680 [bacterium]|nr:hypothetical protein [bacterium]
MNVKLKETIPKTEIKYMKKQTRAQKCSDYADAFKCIKEGKPVKRLHSKDRSIPTHPIVEVRHPYPEKDVLHDCLVWLRREGILCDRNNVGAGQIGESGYYSYGIKDAGDIIGLLQNGQHFEIECKRSGGGRLSYGQQKRMKKIRENNGLYFVIHGIAELEYYFKDIVQ